MSEKRSMRFQTRIFLTVICVALVPIILCFALLLPVMVSTSTRRQSATRRICGSLCRITGAAWKSRRMGRWALAYPAGRASIWACLTWTAFCACISATHTA